jgi:hypothetical protein
MDVLRVVTPLLLCAACSPLRPQQSETPYGNPEGREDLAAPAPVAEPDYEPPMGWSVTNAEECGVSFAMPEPPKRAELQKDDGVHAVYTVEIGPDTRLSVDCGETPNATPEQVTSLRDELAKTADRGEVEDLGPFEVGHFTGHGYQLTKDGKIHRYRVVIIAGRKVLLSVVGAHEYPGLSESLRPLER